MPVDASFFRGSFELGSLWVPNRVVLSPLAGVSDVPFRRVCTEFGAGLTYVEMLSSVAINYGSERTFDMLARHEDEGLLGVQLTGPSAEVVAQAVGRLDGEGFDTIDLNMGCPVKKIVRKGGGSGILREPERVTETLGLSREATRLPLSAKIRIGFSREEVNVEDISGRVAEAGADMLTIHGRTRGDSYAVSNDYGAIRRGFERVGAVAASPVLMGNGDVMDYGSACRMVDETGCDAVLVSRGALGNPWIFREILSGDAARPLVGEWLDVVLRHLDYHLDFYGESRLSIVAFRKHLLWYASGFRGARPLRVELSVASDVGFIRERLRRFVRTLSAGTRRYDSGEFVEERSGGAGHDPKFEMDRKYDRGVGDDEG